jgi:DNA/RNA-binding domain of Phe-tRNA-synthetase-like protein
VRIGIDQTVFEGFPGYRRGLVVARGVSNRPDDPVLAERLRNAQRALQSTYTGVDWREDPRVAAWAAAFRQLGVNPNARPPSVAALVKRVAKGANLPFINQLVALMNITSLEHLVPCGGDDLDKVGGGLTLRPATGTESYRPLGKPHVVEHPDPGEIVLVGESGDVVLCRAWCWRNSEITKLTEATSAVALNVDLMPVAVSEQDGIAMTERLAEDVSVHCGGEVDWVILTADVPCVQLWE